LDNKLSITHQTFESLAKKYGTPLYVYDAQLIRKRCTQAVSLFEDLPVSWLYAIKANDNPHILKVIRESGVGFDTVSLEEVLLCGHFTDNPAEIFYTENSMSDEEMNEAIRLGVTLNIGAVSRLERFFQHPDSRECSLRINPAIGEGHHTRVNTGDPESKFGVRLDLIDDCVKMADKYGKKIVGLHAHIGSGIKRPENLVAAMKVLLEAASGFKDLRMINFGGGVPTPYHPDDQIFDLDEFAKLAGPVLKEDLENRPEGFRYLFEPGRWYVAEAGTLLTTIHTIKNQVETLYLGTDTGMHHLLRPMLYDAWHRVENVSKPQDAPQKVYTIAGNICESGDILAEDRAMPDSEVGDVVAIRDAGAYGMTMASQYNRRSLPGEILVEKDGVIQVIRAPKNAQETVNEFLRECAFEV